MKNKEVIFCQNCTSKNVIKHGKKNGIQRYYCKDCKKTFIKDVDKKRKRYSSKEKAFLSMLLSFLQPINNENYDLKQIIKNLDESSADISRFRFKQVEFNDKVKEIQCYQPKILICKENNIITIYHFDLRHSIQNTHREIKIIDDDFYAKNKSSVPKHRKSKHLTPEERYILKLKTERNLISEEEMLNFGFYDDKYNEDFYQNDLDEY